MDNSTKTYPEFELIENFAIKDFVAAVLAFAREDHEIASGSKKTAPKKKKARHEPPGLSLQARAAVYIASKLCCHRRIEGYHRDIVIAACLLRDVEAKFGALRLYQIVEGQPEAADVFLCLKKLSEGTKVYPKDYEPYEQVLLLATLLSLEKYVGFLGLPAVAGK